MQLFGWCLVCAAQWSFLVVPPTALFVGGEQELWEGRTHGRACLAGCSLWQGHLPGLGPRPPVASWVHVLVGPEPLFTSYLCPQSLMSSLNASAHPTMAWGLLGKIWLAVAQFLHLPKADIVHPALTQCPWWSHLFLGPLWLISGPGPVLSS